MSDSDNKLNKKIDKFRDCLPLKDEIILDENSEMIESFKKNKIVEI
jgi:hypothetical protein